MDKDFILHFWNMEQVQIGNFLIVEVLFAVVGETYAGAASSEW